MKKILWFGLGLLGGFVLAHEFSKTEKGKELFDEVNRRSKEFTSAVNEGFKEREAELREALAQAQDAVADITDN